MKRAYLKTLAYGAQVLGRVPGMTGARFDLLCLIRQKHIDGTFEMLDELATGVSQGDLLQRLDLHKSTVSKMLGRLEEMGWIRRARATRGDRRRKLVFLTADGLRRIAKAMRIMFRQRMLLKYFERIYKEAEPYRRRHVVETLFDTSNRIQFIANAFGDRSFVVYDYGAPFFAGPPDTFAFPGRPPFDRLYVPPPPVPQAPKPLVGDAREPCRPVEFTEYEDAIRRVVWNQEKPRRRRRPVPDEMTGETDEMTDIPGI